ncbi:AraC family transcriptional regulator [Paracrocinitomix mangrovi]|uniref:AraC family transcriptional regulator n=1 Tax=Paracrocinitomix mangrovi TaxID=2862509 RepID=UPI001C8DB006|nr:AraC family transcriptional regulator [Paracrocinitomix mangrovi]UKN01353.1 AraC family transcriptional regulator [Paracrocinitomix mangrovi]
MSDLNRQIIESRVQTLVENQSVFQADASELNMFETYKVAERVDLTFDYPVIVSMLSGKKVMHLQDMDQFNFFPGETLVMPVGQEMIIDFPEASFQNPTQCLALGIDPSLIRETINNFNEKVRIENDDFKRWEIAKKPGMVHAQNDIQHLMNRITMTFINQHNSRDMLLDYMLKELIVRLLQTEARSTILRASSDLYNNNRIAYIVRYIKQNLSDKLTVEGLADKAYMSASHFHRVFKDTIGESPVSFILQERIKFAKRLLNDHKLSISQVAGRTGFNNPAYFTRQFKKSEGMSPQAFRMMIFESYK